MANDFHLALLIEGRAAWNQYRVQNAEPGNFSLAVLDEQEFEGFNFFDCDFSGAKLRGTTFANSRLSGAKFEAADLTKATFLNSKLTSCDMRRATLTDAAMQRCDVSKSDLTGAILRGTNFSGSNLQEVIGVCFDRTCLRDVELSPYAHDGWSILRRSYSGSRLFFHLVLLIVSSLPFAVQTFTWVLISLTQQAEGVIGMRSAKNIEDRVEGTIFQSKVDTADSPPNRSSVLL